MHKLTVSMQKINAYGQQVGKATIGRLLCNGTGEKELPTLRAIWAKFLLYLFTSLCSFCFYLICFSHMCGWHCACVSYAAMHKIETIRIYW